MPELRGITRAQSTPITRQRYRPVIKVGYSGSQNTHGDKVAKSP